MPYAKAPGLARQVIPVSFSGGLDTKTAEQLVVPGKFLVLENCVRRKTGRIEKRNGFSALGTGTTNRPAPHTGSPLSEGKKLSTLADELVLRDSNSLYSYAESNNSWDYKGECPSVSVTSTQVIRNSGRQAMPDGTEIAGIQISAWEDSRGGVRYSAYDSITGSALAYDKEITPTGSRPRVASINQTAFIFYIDGGQLKYKTILVTNPTAFASSSPTNWLTSVADVAYDVYATEGHFVFSVNKTDTSILVGYINESGVIGNGANGLPATASIAPGTAGTSGSSVYADAVLGKKYVYVVHLSSTTVVCTAFSALLTVQSTVSIATGTDPRNSSTILKTGATNATVIYERVDTDSGIFSVDIAFNGITATLATSPSIVALGVGMVSKAFEVGGHIYVLSAFESQLQPSCFLIRSDGLVVARIASGISDGTVKDANYPGADKTGLPSVFTNAQGVPQTLIVTTSRLQADAGGTVHALSKGIQKTALDFSGAALASVEAGNGLIIPGGSTLLYDGVSAVEAGFHVYPEPVIAAAGVGGGTFPSTGLYSYKMTYEWVDAQGQIHRSAPSILKSVNFASTAGYVTFHIPTLRLTNKSDAFGRVNAVIAIYRSTAGQSSVLYKLKEIENDVSVDYISYTDNNADGVGLELREVIYTTGGVVENIAPPACKVSIKHKNRVVLAGLERPGIVAYSKELVYGEAPAFTDTFTLSADSTKGGVTALGSLDDKLILFKKDSILAVAGDGPLETGAQNDFSQPQQLDSDVGCSNQDSILTIPTGLVFQSDKGIYLLNRTLGTGYIGASVEAFNSYKITSAVLLEDVNEARFTTLNGPTLVYNYFFDQWSVFTNYEAEHAITALGSYLHLKSDGRIMKEDSGYLDNESRIAMAIETSWLALNNLQGYQRVYKYEFLGDYLSNHITRVKVGYDYEPVFTQTVYYNAGDALNLTAYGDDPTYGESTVYGGDGSLSYQFFSKPRRQKCKAIKFRLEDLDTLTENGGGSFNLVSLALLVGVKEGMSEVSKTKEI